MILSIGNSGTYEVEAFKAVLAELATLGQNAVLFKQDKCLEGEYLDFEVTGNKTTYKIVIDE
ncbi:MAG TPA: hypothetical protein PLF70_01685 [Candidatus Portnoybacteria bacterium]|nr:hypothetical protein [Candidatus Portnoybacteria bacterium]